MAGESVECAGIINCDEDVFPLAVWAGVNGEKSGRAKSERRGQVDTTPHDESPFYCCRREKH